MEKKGVSKREMETNNVVTARTLNSLLLYGGKITLSSLERITNYLDIRLCLTVNEKKDGRE